MEEPIENSRKILPKSPNKLEEGSKPDPDGWKEIGTLQNIIIYPIEGGAGCSQEHAPYVYFSKSGLSNRLDTAGEFADKGLVLFSARYKRAIIRPYNTLKYLNSKSLYMPISKKLTDHPYDLKTVYIQYFNDKENDRIEVKDLGDDIAQIIAEKLGLKDIDLRIGIRSADNRCNYNFNIRNKLLHLPKILSDNEINILTHNFASYTLVNTTHLKELEIKCRKHISFKNFHPNLVVEGKPGVYYKEDDVEQIKISDEDLEIVFPIVCAWSHSTTINENSSETPEDLLCEPYNTLAKNRIIPSIQKEDGSDLPKSPVFFGLKMEMNYNFQGKIRTRPKGTVFAKFKKPEESKSPPVQKDSKN